MIRVRGRELSERRELSEGSHVVVRQSKIEASLPATLANRVSPPHLRRMSGPDLEDLNVGIPGAGFGASSVRFAFGGRPPCNLSPRRLVLCALWRGACRVSWLYVGRERGHCAQALAVAAQRLGFRAFQTQLTPRARPQTRLRTKSTRSRRRTTAW